VQSALYFAFIRGREGEIQALRALSPFARARMAVVADLPTPKVGSTKSIELHINGFASNVIKAWGTKSPIYLDMKRHAPNLIDARGRAAVEHLFDCARQLKALAIPVTGPLIERGPETLYVDAVAKIAAQDGRGAAFRIEHEDFSDPDVLRRELDKGIKQLHLSSDMIDLFLDAGGLEFLPDATASEAELLDSVRNAAEVCRSYNFRNIVFAASSVPQDLSESTLEKPMKIVRSELRVWRELTLIEGLPLIRFGDTCVWSPRQPDTGGGGGGPAPARVRFPIGDEQVFFRAPSNTYREVCRAVVRYPGFDALPRSRGLDEIKRCALGNGPEEAATTWVARDTNIHMEATARQIQRHFQSCGRIKEISLRSVTAEPWQQESLPQLEF
jgi:hypothetical protein